ncbi:MAG: hypothetical protein LBN22_04530 [Clostridiales Family XIII bacterium]|jgi:hypothetical protein|nr:hypothetical protein [Clostridiales Family XIII bacterium]
MSIPQIHIHYQLTSAEVAETLLCLAWKREGLRKQVHSAMLIVLFCGILFFYMKNPDRSYLLVLAGFVLFTLFFILFGANVIRKRKASKIASIQGEYRLNITKDGISTQTRKHKDEPRSDDGHEAATFAKSSSEMYLSEHVISIKIGAQVYCIPKRTLTDAQIATITNDISQYCVVREVKTVR